MIKVELVYKDQKTNIMLPEHTRIATALASQPLYQQYLKEVPEPHIGIFGKIVATDHILQAGERIELYFPLLCHPREKRKQKVKRSISKQKI